MGTTSSRRTVVDDDPPKEPKCFQHGGISLKLLRLECDPGLALPAWMPKTPEETQAEVDADESRSREWFLINYRDAPETELQQWCSSVHTKPLFALKHRKVYASWIDGLGRKCGLVRVEPNSPSSTAECRSVMVGSLFYDAALVAEIDRVARSVAKRSDSLPLVKEAFAGRKWVLAILELVGDSKSAHALVLPEDAEAVRRKDTPFRKVETIDDKNVASALDECRSWREEFSQRVREGGFHDRRQPDPERLDRVCLGYLLEKRWVHRMHTAALEAHLKTTANSKNH